VGLLPPTGTQRSKGTTLQISQRYSRNVITVPGHLVSMVGHACPTIDTLRVPCFVSRHFLIFGGSSQYLLSKDERLIQVSGCGKKAKEREEKKRAQEEEEARAAATAASVQADAAARREEEGKVRWSAAKKESVARRNVNLQEPEGWSDDPRRCPFGWLYCSGVCMGLTPAEFKATKQHVWVEESDFYRSSGASEARNLGSDVPLLDASLDLSLQMSLNGALQALGMLASGGGAGGSGWRREQEKKKKSKGASGAPVVQASTACNAIRDE